MYSIPRLCYFVSPPLAALYKYYSAIIRADLRMCSIIIRVWSARAQYRTGKEIKMGSVNCTYDHKPLDRNTTDRLTLARGYTAVGTLAFSCVLFVLAFCNLVRKRIRFHKECYCYWRFLIDYAANPFFLLALISLLPVATYCIVLGRYSYYGDETTLDNEFCKWPGWLLLWFESAETIALAVFSLYLLYYVLWHRKDVLTERIETVRVNNEDEYFARIPEVANAWYWVHSTLSIVAFVVIILISGAYTNPYFVKIARSNDTYSYGETGPWCWIKPERAQEDFWFYEEWTYMGISLFALFAAYVLLCCVTRDQEAKYRCLSSVWWDRTILVPYTIFVFYFLLQFGIMAVEYLIRICKNSDKALWYTYAIGKPLSKIFLVIAALQLMSTSYRMGKKKYVRLSTNNPEAQPDVAS